MNFAIATVILFYFIFKAVLVTNSNKKEKQSNNIFDRLLSFEDAYDMNDVII